MATAFSSLRARLFALLLLALLLLLAPLAWLSAREAERAASEDLRRALYTRLYLLQAEGVQDEERLLLELFRLAQLFGGGVGFVLREGEARFTQLGDWPLPPGFPRLWRRKGSTRGSFGGRSMWPWPKGARLRPCGAPGRGFRARPAPPRPLRPLGRGALLGVFLLAALALSWTLRPLRDLEKALRARAPEDLSPLPDPGLAELRPVVAALNALFARVGRLLAELAEKEEAARRFARHASHELRTPLTALKGYLEVLRRKNEPRALEGALREAGRMEALLAGLLRLSRLGPFRPRGSPWTSGPSWRPRASGSRGGEGPGRPRAFGPRGGERSGERPPPRQASRAGGAFPGRGRGLGLARGRGPRVPRGPPSPGPGALRPRGQGDGARPRPGGRGGPGPRGQGPRGEPRGGGGGALPAFGSA